MGYEMKVLYERFPALEPIAADVAAAYNLIKRSFETSGTLFVCGNGGSAADAEHVVGELMKGFLLARPIRGATRSALNDLYGRDGESMAEHLQEGLPAVSLTGHPALSTAFANDQDPELVFAQQLYALANPGDALLVFSTSGNSGNVVKALMLAKVLKVVTIAMTGSDGGKCAELADTAVRVPETETYKVQELHLPIYHALCAALEEDFYGDEK